MSDEKQDIEEVNVPESNPNEGPTCLYKDADTVIVSGIDIAKYIGNGWKDHPHGDE